MLKMIEKKLRRVFGSALVLGSFCIPMSEAMEDDLSQLTEEISEVEHIVQTKLREVPPNTPRVLLLGATGGGKSTLLHSLVGRQLIVARTPFVKLEAKNPLEGFSIGHTADSETKIPGLLYDQSSKVVYCDCPGFFDNRGGNQEIVNAFAIDQLFTAPSKIKILLVISIHEIMAVRADRVKEQFQKIEELVSLPEVLQSGIAVVITKADSTVEVSHCLELLATAKGKVSSLLNFLLSNSSRVFSFPNPGSEKEQEPYNSFIDREKVIRFLCEDNSTLINPVHRIILDAQSTVQVLKIANGFGNIKSLLRDLINKLSEKFRSEELSGLYVWRDIISKLRENIPDSPVDFVEKASLTVSHPEEYSDIFEKIRRFQPLRSFLDRIFCSLAEKGEIDELGVANIKENSFFQFIFADIPSNFGPLADDCLHELKVLIEAAEEHQRELVDLQRKHEEELANIKLINDDLAKKVDAMRLDSSQKHEEMQNLQQKFEEAQKQAEKRFQRELEDHMKVSEQRLREVEESLEKERREKERKISSLMADFEHERHLTSDLEKVTRERNELQTKLNEIRGVTSNCDDCGYKVKRIIDGDTDCTIQ